MADSRQEHDVETYPAAPGAVASTAFRVTVDGTPAFVEAYAGVSYVRFAFRGVAVVEVAVHGEVGAVRLLPRDAATSEAGTSGTLRLTLTEPRPFVAWIGDREKLFVLADHPESPPIADGAAVVAVDPPEDRHLATHAIQAAIDRVAARPGGGTVVLRPGRYVSGTIKVASRVTLYLSAGAVLEGSDDPADYPVDPGRVERGRDTTLSADARYDGRTMTFSRLVLVDDATDVQIRGRGTDQRQRTRPPDPPRRRPEPRARAAEPRRPDPGRAAPRRGGMDAAPARLGRRRGVEREDPQRPRQPQHRRHRPRP